MFEALGRKTRGFAEKNWSEKAQQGIAQLQAGAGNEIGQETPFEEVTRSDFFVSWLFFSWMFGAGPSCVSWFFPTPLNGLERE